MIPRRFNILALVLILSLLVTMLPACKTVSAAESYMAVIPEVLHSGQTEEMSLALFEGDRLVPGDVEVTLLSDGEEVLRVKKSIDGKGTISLDIPDIEDGEYEIMVSGNGFEDKATVKVEKSFLTFIETDKPIYKPGQTICISLYTLNNELRPVEELVTIEVLDAKGIKIFRTELTTDEYGMASLELPLSQEPNLGAWKITAETGYSKAQLDVQVEEYVLPKYEIDVQLPRQWFLADEVINGSISAEYSFGKPVAGELEIIASRYVGEWEEYATLTKAIDGDTSFEIPAVGYVAGTPAAAGMGNVILDVIVRETATGYEEQTSLLLTVAETPLNIQIIPESTIFKPGLPFNILLVTENPANESLDASLDVTVTYLNAEYEEIDTDNQEIVTDNGTALFGVTPPDEAVAMIIEAFELTPVSSVPPAEAEKIVTASYSPSGNFIHLEQVSDGIPEIGEEIVFKVNSTREASNFYYEVVARGNVVFSDFTKNTEIAFEVTPLMAPSSTLLVYQILPNSEVAADYLPFKVTAEYPHSVAVEFSSDEASPGEEIEINIETEGEAKVSISVVDKSVFILAENRLNLQQVFDELERLYMQPQVEIHEATIYPAIVTEGASDVFEDAGVIVLSNNDIPQGEKYQMEGQTVVWDEIWRFLGGDMVVWEADGGMVPVVVPAVKGGEDQTAYLAEVDRVRQYFPETWLWEEITVDADGNISIPVTVPDTITTWMLHAVAISKEAGLGMAEGELIAFQPFFIKVDLPYSAIRGEEFPVEVAVYNYTDEPQEVFVQIEEEGWFELLDDSQKSVTVAANGVGSVEFLIRTEGLGYNEFKITARSIEVADAVISTLLVQPEGVPREFVENLVLIEGDAQVVDTSIPEIAVADSGRAYIAITSSFLTQTIDGLEGLIQMPFGCGEQNMIVFAPDVYITRYLQESGQLKAEVMAKAEKLMITGYQRELTYRRSDGSFSAFGQSDAEGSLFLTAFVLKSFAEAEGLIFIDDAILDEAADWLISHQNSDGSFEPVGFVHHQEMLGGLQGKTPLTAYTAIALMEYGENTSSAKAVAYLESVLNELDDPYTVAITAYALELAGSASTDDAYRMLMELAIEDENGLYWSGGDVLTENGNEVDRLVAPKYPMEYSQSADIETTAYATLALINHGDAFNASRAAKWLVSQRNAYGGFGSTQDTVMALQALIEYSTGARADVDLNVTIKTSESTIEKTITAENFDVLQIVEVPINDQVEITTQGEGEAIAQVVRRFNIPQAETGEDIIRIDVDYDTTEVEVNDIVTVSVELEFNPPQPMEAGMIVLDISIPTGFTPVMETITAVVDKEAKIKRYEVAGRKVIFYIDNMQAGDSLSFSFEVQAMFPVKAKGVVSEAYSYYQPEIKGETLGEEVTVS